jgi:large subunit ribosomal protein L15
MQLHELSTPREKPKGRVGRGIAAGQGKTAGRGTKGQKARTGYKAPKRIPGMMSASDYRLPKRKGFTSHRPEVLTVTFVQIEAAYSAGETVSPDTLTEKKIIKGYGKGGVKVVATGKLTKKLTFDGVKMSKVAADLAEKIS